MNTSPRALEIPTDTADYNAAHNSGNARLPMHLPRRARRIAFWAATVATAAAAPYFAAIALYVAAGFSGLPPMGTRILASVSDVLFAPAMIGLLAGLGWQSRPEARIQTRLSMAILLVFSGLVFVPRILQLPIILGWTAGGSSLDLYGLNTPASAAAMFAWGPAIGSAAILISKLFAGDGLAGWTRRLFVLWGILAIAGWALTIVGSMLEDSLPVVLVVGSIVRVTSYMLPPASTAVAAWLLRDSLRAPAGQQAAPLSR